MDKKCIIVGAGIIGASLAYYLARAGAEVHVLDALPASGGVATPKSWAWINASWGNDPHYVKLRLRAIEEWHGLGAVHPKLTVNWCGGLLWDLPEAELKDYAALRNSSDYPLKLLHGAAISEIEPDIARVPDFAIHATCEGMIEPVVATEGFAAAAIKCGARFHHHVEVVDFITSAGMVSGVRTSDNHLYADEIVIAAGVQSAALLKLLGMKLAVEAIPGLLVHSVPTRLRLNGLVMAANLHVRQTAEGRLVAGSDFGGTQPGDDPAATAQVLFEGLKNLLRDSANLKMDYYSLGERPTPVDGIPAIGRPRGMNGLYLAVMHSGITLAPAAGLFAATEILTGERDGLLSAYHPDRLIS